MKPKVIFAVMVGLMWFSLPACAQMKVRAEGIAVIRDNRVDIARDKALDGALRSAVEKVVGVMVSSTSEVENFQLKMDRILSESKGFINTYKIASEKRQQDQYEVTVDAEVGRERLRERLEAISLIIARKSKPRIMLLFTEQAQRERWEEIKGEHGYQPHSRPS